MFTSVKSVDGEQGDMLESRWLSERRLRGSSLVRSLELLANAKLLWPLSTMATACGVTRLTGTCMKSTPGMHASP